MLEKFIKIQNVGRFQNYSASGDLKLKRTNLIFAPNGRGKTTVCAILRSMHLGEPGYILERGTIGDEEPAYIDIRIEDRNAVFSDQAWNEPYAAIEIFDSTFVNENVFVGDYVDLEQKRNQYKVIIGSEGVALAEEVKRIDEEIKRKTSEIGTKRSTVQGIIPKGFAPMENFLKIPMDPDVNKKIKKKTGEVTAAKRATDIKTKGLLSELPTPTVPQDFESVLRKGVDGLGEEAEKKVQTQIDNHEMHEKGEEWLAEGTGYIKNDVCPFCSQNIGENPLITAYKAFFGESYRQLQAEIENTEQQIEDIFGSEAIATVERTFLQNENLVDFWKQFITLNIPEVDFPKEIKTPMREIGEAADALIRKKTSSPLKEISVDSVYLEKNEIFKKVTENIAAYNTAVKTGNAEIERKKEETEGLDEVAVQGELDYFKAAKERHTETNAKICDEYQTALNEKATLETQKTAAKEKLDTQAEATLKRYEGRINEILKSFGTDFKIKDVKRAYPGGVPSANYKIVINDTAIDLGDSSTPIGTTCFRNTLSAGDKSTLAFAFFLAKLEHDKTKGEKVVVFDDPFNSQDRSRRTRTKELIIKCGEDSKQILVFSHDPYFLRHLWDSLPSGEQKTLQLSRKGRKNTAITEWDIEKETQEGYFQEHAALVAFLEEGRGGLRDIARKIRPLLETYLRYRFPGQFADKEWLGDMLKVIEQQGESHQVYDLLEEVSAINNFSKKYHHKTNPNADTEPIDDDELQGYVGRTLEIVGGY